MPLMSPSEYKQSLNDGRVVYYRGERVEDVAAHPVIGIAVDHAAIDYEMAEDESRGGTRSRRRRRTAPTRATTTSPNPRTTS